MRVELRFFASVREVVGQTHETVILPEHVRTAGQARTWLAARGGAWADAMAEGKALRMAYNHSMTSPNTVLTEGCELAFFPPVTGG